MLAMGVFGYLGDYVLWWLIFLSLLVHTWCFFKFFPREKRRKLRLVAGNALIFVCMLAAAALIGESYFRFVSVETDAFGMSLPARRWFASHTKLNSLGCRDEEWTREKPSGVRRVAFVGDSFSYGWGIERVENRFSDRIQAMFDRRSPGTVEVMNVAKPGWDTIAQLQPIKDMISVYGVDEIVLCYVANDIEKLLPTSPEFDPTRPPTPRWFNPDSSCLLGYLYYRIWVPHVPTVCGYHDWLAEGFADPQIWRLHQQQLGAIISHCKDQGVALRVLLLPFIRTGGEKFHIERIHATLHGFFELNETHVLDLLPVIAGHDPAELTVSSHDAHPNKLAHQLFADAIWEAFYATGDP